MEGTTTFSKFYCSKCGTWLGVKEKDTPTKGIYPYCKRCKKNVEIISTNSKTKSSAKVPQ